MPPDAVMQAVVRLPNVNGLTEDLVENVIHFALNNPFSIPDMVDALEAVRDFYIVDQGATHMSPGSYMSPGISRVANACQILGYATDDLTGATPFGPPDASINFTMPAAFNATGLPTEVAVVLSYHGDLAGVPITQVNPTPPPATIRPAQRRRGRMYFGPLNLQANQFGAGQSRPNTTMLGDLGESFSALATATSGLGDVLYLGVWSKADADVWEYEGGYADDAWDTQRRRGVDPTSRYVFP